MRRLRIPVIITSVLMVIPTVLCAQPFGKAAEELERLRGLDGLSGIIDRAGGTHNRSNIGEFFENRGKLHARFFSQGPSGEFPIGSTKEYIYRVNPMVGVPGNVVQGRYTTNEEWEAAAGFHNRDSGRIAFSDRPSTWPPTGWPVRDVQGNPVLVSDQDSYCVYNDSTNSRTMLGLQISQTGYAFSAQQIRDMIFFTFDVVNRSVQTYDSLYFGLYIDCDVGNFPGGVAEYGDDRVGFNHDLQLMFFYDDGLSSEWPDGTTGHFGMAMLQTPLVGGSRPGVTDWHYSIYDDDLDRDTVQYGIMSSAPSLYASALGPRYFHLGGNYPNLHFDDTTTIPATGLDILATMSSGPYTLGPGDTLRFVTVMVGGNDRQGLFTSTQRAIDLFGAGFVTDVAEEPGLPSGPVLLQNYPNPFNPATTMEFSIPMRSFATLKVFDALGKELAVLVAEELSPGRYAIEWNASGVPSGVYFYRLQAGTTSKTRKLMLIQ